MTRKQSALKSRAPASGSRWLSWVSFTVAVLLLAFNLGASRPAKTVRIVARYPVSADPSPATDVRWASDQSVYLARADDGVFEVALKGGLKARKIMVPRGEVLGRFKSYQRLAVSSDRIVVASGSRSVAWRSTASEPAGTVRFDRWAAAGLTEDLDLAGGRLLLLGSPDRRYVEHVERGIAWIGTLQKHLEDLRPVLTAPPGTSGFPFDRCFMMELGAVRFLEDGSFLVVPGIQPGAFLYDPAGNLLRTWDTREMGLNTDCTWITAEEEAALRYAEPRLAWVNQRRVLDEILPLTQGPGLVVRSKVGSTVRWQLKLLRPEGVMSYELPIVSDKPFDRLRGDVRNGKIVLLRSAHVSYLSGGRTSPGELIVAEMPTP